MAAVLPLAPLAAVNRADFPETSHSGDGGDTAHAIPLRERIGKGSLSMSWYSLVSGMFYLVTAATLAAVVGTVQAIIGIVVASLVYGALGMVFSRFATRTGLSVAMLSQRVFGTVGAIIAPLILTATAIYYAVFEAYLVAHALDSFVGGVNILIWYAVVILLNLPLILGGIRRWMDKYNAALMPVYWVGLLVIVVLAAAGTDTSGWAQSAPVVPVVLAAPGWLYACFVYLGVLVLIMFTVDFARFGRPKDTRVNGVVTFGPVFYLILFLANGLIGIFIAYAAGLGGDVSDTAIVDHMLLLIGGWGLVLVWVTQARVNTANFFVAATNLEALWNGLFRSNMSRVVSAVICAAAAYALMLTDVLSYLLVALAWQGAFISSWVGIMLVYILTSRDEEQHGDTEFRSGRLATASIAVLVWVVCSLSGAMLYQFGGDFGTAWSTPVTLAVSAAAYLAVRRLRPRDGLLTRGHDPRDEVEDFWDVSAPCSRCGNCYLVVEMDRDPSRSEMPAICSGCAQSDPQFRAACLREHRRNVRNSLQR